MKAMKWMTRLSVVLFAMIMTACGNSDSFLAEGTVEGLGTRNMRAIYETPGGLQSVNVTAVDSHFRFEGNAPEETVVELYTNTQTLIGRFVVRNGDALNVGLKLDNPFYLKSSGNKTGGRLADFLAENNFSPEKLNDAVDRYISANPKQPLSPILAAYYYDSSADPERAVELIDMLDNASLPRFVRGDRSMIIRSQGEIAKFEPLELRSNIDSLSTLKAASKGRTLVIFDINPVVGDSTVEAVDSIAKLKDVSINYVRLAPDTLHLSSNTVKFPKKTKFFRAPGGPARPDLKPLLISSFPFYIVVDSTSTQVCRTTSLDELVKYLYN